MYDPCIKIVGDCDETKMRAADRQYERIRQKYERAVRVRFRAIFKTQGKLVREIEEPNLRNLKAAVDASQPEMLNTLRWLYRGLARDIYPMVKDDMDGKAYSQWIQRKWLEIEDLNDVYAIHMEDWINRYSMLRVTYISEATMRELQRMLDMSTSVEDFRIRMNSRWPGLSETRASRIARTETCGGSNAASLEAVRSMDSARVQMKTWRCIADSVTRDTHSMMDNVAVPVEDLFTWYGPHGAVSMDHPGDSMHGAPAAEVVNCRCRMHFNAVKR